MPHHGARQELALRPVGPLGFPLGLAHGSSPLDVYGLLERGEREGKGTIGG
jgi:hypothetical protein